MTSKQSPHLYCLVRHADAPITLEDVAEEWLWYIRENELEINIECIAAYTKAIIFSWEYIDK